MCTGEAAGPPAAAGLAADFAVAGLGVAAPCTDAEMLSGPLAEAPPAGEAVGALAALRAALLTAVLAS